MHQCIMHKVQNKSPILKLFYYHTPNTKTCCVPYITLLCISWKIHNHMTVYNQITVVQKLLKLVVIDQLTLVSLELNQPGILPLELLLQLGRPSKWKKIQKEGHCPILAWHCPSLGTLGHFVLKSDPLPPIKIWDIILHFLVISKAF